MATKKQAEKAVVWGTPEYLKTKFADIVDVAEMSRKCQGTKLVKSAVNAVSSEKDRLQVHKVYRAKFQVPGEKAREGVIAWVSVGINGAGKQTDYLSALKQLVSPGEFRIFDCVIDAIDDLADFLCTFDANGAAASVLKVGGRYGGDEKKCGKSK